MRMNLITPFIKKTKNHCINCINYIKYQYTDPYDEIYNIKTKIGNCYMFGKENLVTGEIEYENAMVCRMDKTKCGNDGNYYKKT